MGLSKQEWHEVAERSAAAKFGERHSGWYTFRRFYAVPTGIAIAGGSFGLGVWWVWSHLLGPLFAGSGPDAHRLGLGFWFVVAIAFTASVLAYRVRLFGLGVLLRAIVVVLGWLGLFAYAVALL